MHIKIHGGTPAGEGKSLCDSCRHSRIVRGRTLDEEIVFCDVSPMKSERITFKVTSCSDYADHCLPTYWELMQEAWILQPGSRKRPAGFVRAQDLDEDPFEHARQGFPKRR